jgi:hypothetical protein
MTQPSLYDGPPGDVPYRKGSRTSRQAAERISQDLPKRHSKLWQLLQYYRDTGCTDSEIAAATGWPRSSICSLRMNLITRGLVTKSDEERPGPYQHKQTVWVVTSRGREAGRSGGE